MRPGQGEPSMNPPPLPRNVKVLGLASLLNDVASEMIFPLLPDFLLTVLGGGRFALGVIEGAADSAASLLKLWSGVRGGVPPRRRPARDAGARPAAGTADVDAQAVRPQLPALPAGAGGVHAGQFERRLPPGAGGRTRRAGGASAGVVVRLPRRQE